MSILDVLLIGVGLSMDAFSVAVCKGLNMKKINWRHTLVIALFFGVFQALMPAVGFALGQAFEVIVRRFAPWIAFILLGFIGGKMVWEAVKGEEEAPEGDEKLNIKELFILAVATSIDALATGIVFAGQGIGVGEMALDVSLIGCTTFLFSFAGVAIGNRFGARYNRKAEFVGGAVLIGLGIKFLLEALLG